MSKSERPRPHRPRLPQAAWVVFSGLVLLAALALFVPGKAAAQTDPPVSGDWVIADSTTINSQTVSIVGNVIIDNGGTLTLSTANLRISSAYPGEFALFVRVGGTLSVTGGTIAAVNPVNTYRFEIHGAATIDGALVQDMWGSITLDKFGIQIYNGNTTIVNSTIQAGQKGNILVSAGSPVIRNNVIRLSRYVEVSNSTFTCGVYVSFNAIGILVVNSSTPVIEGNSIRNNGDPASFTDPWQTYFDLYYNNVSCPWGYYYLYEFLLGYGIIVRGASPEISNNTITLNSAIPSTYQQRTVNGTPVYSYRYAEDWNQGTAGAGLTLAGGGRGNVTGNLIDRNYAYGLFGDGSLARVEDNTIINHVGGAGITGTGVGVNGGLTIGNSSISGNSQGIVLIGSGTGNFESVTLGASTSFPAVFVDYSAGGSLNFYNTSFVGSTVGISHQGQSGATVNLFNCTISQSQLSWGTWATGSINIYWSFQAKVEWPNGAPAANAFAILTNQTQGVLFADLVGSDGLSPFLWIPGILITFTQGSSDQTSNTPLSIKVFANGTISDPFSFVFNESVFIVLVIPDRVPPTLNVFFPTPGQGFNASVVRVNGNAFDVGSGMDRVEASGDGGLTWIVSTDALPGWSMDIAFEDGVHDIAVRAYDNSGTYTEANITGVIVDTVAPDIKIVQPALPATGELIAYTTFNAVILRGTVEDDALLTVNGEPLAVQGGTFSRQLILVEGANFFHIIAVDEVGNRDQVDFVLFSDTIAPAVYVSSPVDNFATNRSILTVAGVTETDVVLTLNDRVIRTTGGVFSESYALSEGANTLRITATDRAGNNNTVVRRVTFDTVAPLITLVSPTANLVTRERDLNLAGSVEESIATVFVNGAPVPTARGTFAKVVRLDEGRNVLVVQAWDAAGNPATVAAVVTLDTVPPTLTVTSPADGALVNSNGVRVIGSWTDAPIVTINDIPVSTSNGDFDEQVGLAEGANELVVVAQDDAGNRVEVRIQVFRDTLAPDLSVSLPATPLQTNASVITVTGRATGAASLRVNGQLVAIDADGGFAVALPLTMGENLIEFRAEDLAGNSQSVLGVVNRVAPPDAPQGLFGLGDLQYVLLPLFLAAGAAATYAVLRARRHEKRA